MKVKSLIVLVLFVFFLPLTGQNIVVAEQDEYLLEPDEFVPLEVMPEMIKEVAPEYPDSAKSNGIEGAVMVKALIDKTGKVVKAEVAKESGKNCGFEKAVVEAALKCLYKPGIQNKKPVAAWVTYKVSFVLEDKETPENKTK